MKKILFTLIILICTNLSSAIASEVDWTPFFKSWEKGCEFNKQYQSFVNNLFSFDDQRVDPITGEIVLPIKYLNAIENKIYRFDEPSIEASSYSDFSLNVTQGSYYGMAVKKIGYVIGHSHGLSTAYFEVQPTDAQLREFLQKVKFESSEQMMQEEQAKTGEYQEIMFDSVGTVHVEKDKVIIVCDVST